MSVTRTYFMIIRQLCKEQAASCWLGGSASSSAGNESTPYSRQPLLQRLQPPHPRPTTTIRHMRQAHGTITQPFLSLTNTRFVVVIKQSAGDKRGMATTVSGAGLIRHGGSPPGTNPGLYSLHSEFTYLGLLLQRKDIHMFIKIPQLTSIMPNSQSC